MMPEWVLYFEDECTHSTLYKSKKFTLMTRSSLPSQWMIVLLQYPPVCVHRNDDPYAHHTTPTITRLYLHDQVKGEAGQRPNHHLTKGCVLWEEIYAFAMDDAQLDASIYCKLKLGKSTKYKYHTLRWSSCHYYKLAHVEWMITQHWTQWVLLTQWIHCSLIWLISFWCGVALNSHRTIFYSLKH